MSEEPKSLDFPGAYMSQSLNLKAVQDFMSTLKILVQNSNPKMTLAKMSYQRPTLKETPVGWTWICG